MTPPPATPSPAAGSAPQVPRLGALLTAVLANVAALERAYKRASTDIPDDELRWKSEELLVETQSDREVLEGLLHEHHPDPARAVRHANAPGHAVAEVLVKVRLQTEPAIHALADTAALETRAGALWRAVEASARRECLDELADVARARAEGHESRAKEHLGRVVDAAFWNGAPGLDAGEAAKTLAP